MQVWQRQKQRHHKHFVGRRIISTLALLLLVGCGGTSSTSGSTSTPPRSTATSSPRATQTPAPGATVIPTPSLEITATPTPLSTRGTTPTSLPTASPCATPAGVQPVSAAEIAIGTTSRLRVALTFDAGGPSEPTARILDILAKHHVHSTFFLTGDWANLNPDLVRRIHSEGHEIGNHTMHHPDLRTLPDQGVCTELNQAEQVIFSLTGVTTRPYYRPPYGGRDSRVRALAAQIGYRTVYWTIDTLDWQTTATSDSITKIVMDNIKNGAIMLMHAGSQVESETLNGLMTKIEQMGYQMVTVTQVLQ
jgi:peptidoglycan/xylan/chitin deacetylase (PgdA/CDA1 family)